MEQARSLSKRKTLFALFCVSLFSLSFETFLTRYFAVALFSEYSYWIISMAMVGYSLSGVFLSIFKDYFSRTKEQYLFLIPLLLLVLPTLAFAVLRVNPFNPLEFQDESLWKGQLVLVFLYYAGLFPVFFVSGLFIGLTFLTFYRDMPKVYAVDLLGAAAGCAVILTAMFFVHPYHLLAVVMPVVFLIVLLGAPSRPRRSGPVRSFPIVVAAAAVLGASLYYMLSVSGFGVPDFKQLHAVLNIAGHSIERSIVSPSGHYVVLDDYQERDDVDMTNNYALMKVGGPPRAFGVYDDGTRIAPLVKRIPSDLSYVRGSLSYFPFVIRKKPSALLVGTNGGFLIVERAPGGGGVGARGLKTPATERSDGEVPGFQGSATVALEEQRMMYRLVDVRFRSLDPGYRSTFRTELVNSSLYAYLRRARTRFDIIEIATDFLAQDENNRFSFTVEAIDLCLDSLTPGGIVSIPVDISEFNIFALKMVNTVISALSRRGFADPSARVMVYRTPFTCRILVSNEPFSASDIAMLKKYCRERSFDTPHYPGIDPKTVTVWNDLPPVSFENSTAQRSGIPRDALMEDLARVFSHSRRSFFSSQFFNLSPSTIDNPDFFSIVRLSNFRALLARVSMLPEQEVGYLLNVIVLGQACFFALVILVVPAVLLRKRVKRVGGSRWLIPRIVLYFSALGLGYLFVELALIGKFSFYLESASTSFGVVLSCMLVFSGAGSWSASRFERAPNGGVLKALPVVGAGLAFYALALDRLYMISAGLPGFVKLAVAVLVIAPVAFAMGRFFPLGIGSTGASASSLVPWAWAVNGAFSVLSTPIANIVSTVLGWKIVFAAAFLLYISTMATFPGNPVSRDRWSR